jgi:hypothetical protein
VPASGERLHRGLARDREAPDYLAVLVEVVFDRPHPGRACWRRIKQRDATDHLAVSDDLVVIPLPSTSGRSSRSVIGALYPNPLLASRRTADVCGFLLSPEGRDHGNRSIRHSKAEAVDPIWWSTVTQPALHTLSESRKGPAPDTGPPPPASRASTGRNIHPTVGLELVDQPLFAPAANAHRESAGGRQYI